MNLFSLFVGIVMAAESSVISPLVDTWQASPEQVTFGKLTGIINDGGQVLGDSSYAQSSISFDNIKPLDAPPPAKTIYRTSQKGSYKIAILGDSMTDTLGPGVPHLNSQLKSIYPNAQFEIINYGVGATNVQYGLERITTDYSYLGNMVPSLVSQNPDLVVVESFGYNPFPDIPDGLSKHWLTLASIVDTLKSRLPAAKIVIAATIAPNAQVFGDGVLAWEQDGKSRKTTEIKQYLENAIKFAQSQNLPLADIYHSSLASNGEGNLIYINPGDHIHYSDTGRALFGKIVSDTIVASKLLE